MKDDDSSLEEQVMANPSDLLLMANGGGLAVPSQYCFALCTFAMQFYSNMLGDEQIRKKFLTLSNQRTAFVAAAAKVAQECESYRILSSLICDEGHNNIYLLFSTSFNCFAKNALKRLNRVETEAPAKMSRSIRKLNSKSSK